jgi:hypothetical protein
MDKMISDASLCDIALAVGAASVGLDLIEDQVVLTWWKELS